MKRLNPFKMLSFFTFSILYQFANSQIIYTDVIPDKTYKCSENGCQQVYPLDLNHDGINDFNIIASSHKTSNKDYKYLVEIIALNGNSVGVAYPEPSPLFANAYEFRFNIGSSPYWSFYGGSLKGVYYTCSLNDNGVIDCVSGSFGYWVKNSDKYLGLKIIFNNQTYLGWARLSVQITSSYAAFTIKDHAYESTPGQFILAGATAGSVTSKMPSHENIKEEIADKNKINIYPNPVSNSAIISFTIPQPGNVSIKIFDLTGKLVRTLVNKEMQPGQHQLVWNTKRDKGTDVPPGIYLVKIDADNYSATKKLSVIK